MLFLLYQSAIFSPLILLLKVVSPSFHIMTKLNKIIPLYKYNHPQRKCHCQTHKNKATRDVRKETHASNTEINALLSQQSVAFLPEPPRFTQSSALTSAQTWVGLCTSWQQGQAKFLGCRWLDGGLAHSGHGWGSKSKLPSVFPKMLVQTTRF